MRNLLLIGATAIAIAASGPAAAQEVTLRLSAHQSANSPDWTRVVEPLIEFIETKSGGRIKVEGYPNGVLHGGADGFKALATNVTDIAPGYPIWLSGSFKLNHVVNLPLAFPSAYVGSRVTEELYDEYFKKEYERLGVYALFYTVTATYDLIATKPMRSIDDVRGMKLRGGGGGLNEIIERLGGTPVTLKSPETYTAFQQGVVDGLLFNTASILSFRLDEVGKYLMPLGISRVGIPWAMNRKTYDALPDDLKEVIYAAGREATIYYTDYVTEDTEAALAAMRDRGIQFVELSDAEIDGVHETLAPMWDDFIKKNGATGRKLVDELRAKVAGYDGMTRDDFVKLQRESPVPGMRPGS